MEWVLAPGHSKGCRCDTCHEISRLHDELAATKEALKPFADLRVTRFMTDGLRYDFRVDAAWIRKARTVGGMEK